MAASAEIGSLKQRAEDLYEAVRTGEVAKGVGAILVQVSHLQLRLVEVETELLKQEELEARIAELERQAFRRWPAA